jgi:hypothetical protein
MAMSQTWLEGFQTRARAALETALSRLDPEWSILAELRIDGPGDDVAADYVAIHPAYGIALIDSGSAGTGDPTDRLRALLDGQKFATIFPGNLPIVYLAVRPADAALIGRRLDAAFAKAPRLTVRNADWAAAVQDLLVPIDATIPEPAPAPASVAEPPPTRPAKPERRSPAPGAKTRPAAEKPNTEALSTPGKAVWGVAPDAKPAPEQPPIVRSGDSPQAGSIAETAASKPTPVPNQPRVDRGDIVDRGNDAPRAATITDAVSPDTKPVMARNSAGDTRTADPISEPIASDETSVPAPQHVDRLDHPSPTGTIAEPVALAEKPAPRPSSLEPSADTPRLDRIAGDGRQMPHPLRLDRAGDIPRARAVTGGELFARRDDAIVGLPPLAPAPQWEKWAAVAVVITLILGGALWWTFSGTEYPAAITGAGRAVADISPSSPLDTSLPTENATPSPTAPSIMPPAPQAGTVAALSPPPAAVDSNALTTPPGLTSPALPPLAPSASLSTPPAEAVSEKPAAATQPVKTPAPPAPSASSTVATKSSTAPPPVPRSRPAPPKPAIVSAKSSIAPPQPESTARPTVSETRSASLQSNKPPSPPSLPAPARYDAPPLGVADLPPLDPTEKPSSAGTAVAAAAADLHGPTSLLPSTSMAAANPAAPPTEVCRAYTSMKTLLGQSRPVSGVTCRGQDGQWHIITELPN